MNFARQHNNRKAARFCCNKEAKNCTRSYQVKNGKFLTYQDYKRPWIVPHEISSCKQWFCKSAAHSFHCTAFKTAPQDVPKTNVSSRATASIKHSKILLYCVLCVCVFCWLLIKSNALTLEQNFPSDCLFWNA